ncbi:BglG family transcription antiterminator [Bacillus sp. AK031]
MFITTREKSIIDLIIRTSGKHTVSSLSAYLNVSGRTVQRNLKSIEKLLEQYNLQLKRTTNDGLFIEGKNEQIYRLIQKLMDVSPTDETPEERKRSLLVILMQEGPFFKKQVLANQLGISTATLSAYLDDLADWLSKFSVRLIRKRGVGIEVSAAEARRRHALASYFLIYFYEEIIENIYLLQKGNLMNGPVLGYFTPEYLVAADKVVNQSLNKADIKLTDSDYTGLIVHVCLSFQRLRDGFALDEDYESEAEYTTEFSIMNEICEELSQMLAVPITKNDIHFLSIVLKGSKVQAPDAIDYDSILLGQLIKNLIEDVSSKLHVNLSDDFSLYQGLLAHMEPSIYRLKQGMELFNPLTEDIKKKYPVLFMAVEKSLGVQFKDISFPDDETAFIVLHFGSALLMNEEKVKINAVVVCPTGIGASKMLASRIQKELTEINKVEILSLKDFQSANLKEYDIVISTVRLPFTDVDYTLVSPLLSEKDIGFIQTYLQNNLEKLTKKKQYLRPGPPQEAIANPNQPKLRTLLQEIKDIQSSIESILNNFRLYRKRHIGNHFTVLRDLVEKAEQDLLIKNYPDVLKQLEEREKKGGLGIPGTKMGLFHCRDENVKELIFQVCHLDQPCPVKGMDGQEMQMKSLLLMLAPEDLSKREQEILSIISTSLIESNISMMIFSSSNEAMIRKKLEDLFLVYLQTNLIKE